jgi:uncharacterized protein (TIGR02611 family)
MFNKLKQYFHDLLEDTPGERFQRQYRRRQQSSENSLLKKILFIGGGVIVIAAGIVDLPFVGPGTVLIIIGLGLIAQESLRLSKFLDRLEVKLREYMSRINNRWKGVSAINKTVIILGILIILAIIGAGIYLLVSHAGVLSGRSSANSG